MMDSVLILRHAMASHAVKLLVNGTVAVLSLVAMVLAVVYGTDGLQMLVFILVYPALIPVYSIVYQLQDAKYELTHPAVQ